MNGIGFAMEMPTCRLEAWTPLTDLDFVLAHKVLEDPVYADFFAKRDASRELILDNSMHELGSPLPIRDLLRAFDLVRADYVVSPDWLDDAPKTLRAFRDLSALMDDASRIAVVLTGETPTHRQLVLHSLEHAGMLCLPFRRPRLEWFFEQQIRHRRLHLLGMSSIQELEAWGRLAAEGHYLAQTKVSMDTAKPVKAGLVGRHIDDGYSLRGMSSSADLLNLPASAINPAQEALIRLNAKTLRQILGGVA